MKLDANIRVGKLVDQYPFLLDTLTALSEKFTMLRNPLMRKTVGQFATLAKAAQIGEIALADLLETLANAIREQAGETVEIDAAEAAPQRAGSELDPDRVAKLKEIIKGLHEGKGVEAVKREFAELVQNVGPGEIAAMVLDPEIDLRIFPAHWVHGYAVVETTENGPKRSLQFFGRLFRNLGGANRPVPYKRSHIV